MSLSLEAHSLLALALTTLACAPAGALVATLEPTPRPSFGPLGVERQRALRNPLFALLEPVVRLLSALIAPALGSLFGWARARAALQRVVERSGNFCGLGPEELLSLAALCGGSVDCAGFALARIGLSISPVSLIALTAVLASAPFFVLRERKHTRERAIARALPALLDLLALCMSAGFDFAAALTPCLHELRDPAHPLACELERVRHDLALGRSRKHALAQLAERVPIAPIEELVAVCIQAEQKGTPLAEVLALAASAARQRRSVLAEEAAARAAILLIAPLGLLMLAILLVLFAPFLINGIGG